MITNKVNPQEMRQWIDTNIQDDLLRQILDEWTWKEDAPNAVVEGGKILGFCASRVEGEFYKCCYFFMHPDARGKGYGKELLELSFAEAKKRELPYLYVSEERFDGWKIFKTKGFPYTIKYSDDFKLKDYYFIVETKNREKLFEGGKKK